MAGDSAQPGAGGEAVMKRDEPYFIEAYDNGCHKCGHDRTWAIVGPTPDEQATSTHYGDEDEASHIAECLNEAYRRGESAKDAELAALCAENAALKEQITRLAAEARQSLEYLSGDEIADWLERRALSATTGGKEARDARSQGEGTR